MVGKHTTTMSVKNMPAHARQTMVALAQAREQTVAEWLVDVIERQRTAQAGDRIEPPDYKAGGINSVKPAQPSVNPINMPELRDTLMALRAVADAAGLPVPQSLARHAFAIARDQLRDARGLQAPASRKPKRKIGKTIDSHAGE